ncbi:MAG: hypothetical protein QOE77_1650 [Blastocatellia bacterium]|jgi:hypothetical protein|nr:hypothetical protein [Blastocatellia bacterium]
MSTLAYAAITTRREQSPANKSTSSAAPGLNTYVDAFAALVPAEVLALHAMIITATTETIGDATRITSRGTLEWAFFGLAILATALYVVPRLLDKKWGRLDYLRMIIPPLAFVGWTMLQRSTAFDAVFPTMPQAARTVAALFLGAVVGGLAAALAYQADQQDP